MTEPEQKIVDAVIKWVEDSRSYVELEAGIGFYRDHFSSEELLDFLRELSKK